MPLESGFALAKVLFCCMPNRNSSILRKPSSSSRFGFALAKMSFCFMRDKSLSMSGKSLSSLLFREFRVAVQFSLQG
jgi:hypothetical protein